MAILTVFSPQKIEETGGNMRVIITIALFIGGSLAFDLPELSQPFDDSDDSEITYDSADVADDFNPETGVEFQLFTLTNPSEPQVISPLNLTTIEASNFNASNPTRFFAHGWKSNGSLIDKFADAYLVRGKHNVNFIAVNWYAGSLTNNYAVARRRVNVVGPYVGRLINLLTDKMDMNLPDVHIVGHSLGAHVAGIAGKQVTNGKVAKIVGLDPASPLFAYNAHALRLHQDDAEYVESIHTNGGRLGFYQPIGQASFYPNLGRIQPGCAPDFTGACSHRRVFELFLESLYSNIEFYGIACDSLQALAAGKCHADTGATMGGEPGNLGNVKGIYFLRTNMNSPFAIGKPLIFH